MKKILLALTGSISCYKTLNILRYLRERNYDVKVVMTKNAEKFISPLSFSTLSRNVVYTDAFTCYNDFPIPHIDLANWADLLLIAPATANIISKISNGIANDLLSSIILAFNKKILIAPAMNTNMWENTIIKRNVKLLKKNKIHFVGPTVGKLACQHEGKGRLADELMIVNHVEKLLSDGLLKGKKVIVTAGGTYEYIDPVRVISNRSSGIMGYECAKEAFKQQCEKLLFIHPSYIKTEFSEYSVIANTHEELKCNLDKFIPDYDILIMSAAVTDFKVVNQNKKKLKRVQEKFLLELIKTEDIVSTVKNLNKKIFVVGFALESENHIENAKKKLKDKNLDLIVANTEKSLGNNSAEFWILNNSNKNLFYNKNINKAEVAKKIIYLINDAIAKKSSN